ncbi:hypothetical protein ACFO3D_18500 [Virgibacillus kekensis]|uniref:Uncharacterized protein n=1 Tax=Virgibacillus kekensis TaxID=202261 RepID=A0ABV9DND3_9BACI
MLISAAILGWIGIGIMMLIALTFPKLAKQNQFGFIHILMALMYTMWLPLPLAMNSMIEREIAQVGMIFGLAYLIMMVVTMTLQTGHIIFAAKNKSGISSEHLMAMLSEPFELMANILKCIWAIFLAVGFWSSGNFIMAWLMILFSLLIVYFFAMLLDRSLVKQIKILSKFKGNPYLFNLETVGFFLALVIYSSISI